MTLALAAALSTAALAQTPQEARLLRFPATNGREVVFTYAGDLWTVPISGGQATRLTSHVGYENTLRTERPSLSPVNTTATAKSIPSLRRAASRSASPGLRPTAAMTSATVWVRTTSS